MDTATEETLAPGEWLRAAMTKRHAAFVDEMWGLFERTVTELEGDLRVERAENRRLRRLLEASRRRRHTVRKKNKEPLKKEEQIKPDQEQLTENSSDSEDDSAQNRKCQNPASDQENSGNMNQEVDLAPEPEVLTENSSDPEDEAKEKMQNISIKKEENDPEICPETENSSELEGEGMPETQSKPTKNFERQNVSRREKKTYECLVCNKLFYFKSIFKAHVANHNDSKPYMCSDCGKSFGNKTHLARHMEIHKKHKPFGGSDPKASPKKIIKLKKLSEIKTTTKRSKTDGKNAETQAKCRKTKADERPCMCLVCKKRFQSKSNLTRHLLIHTRDKPFSCTVCEMRYRYNRDLLCHMAMHIEGKAFGLKELHSKKPCRSSESKRDLVRERPYGCLFCEKAYRYKPNLWRHVKVSHPVEFQMKKSKRNEDKQKQKC